MKKKVLFFTTPAYGHINSVLPIVERLVNKDYQVICYSSKEYKQIIEETGAKYIEYKIDFNVQEIGAYTSNFVELLKALTKLNHEAYEHYVNSIDYTKYDLVLYDSMCAFAKNIAYKKKIKSICIETTLAYNFFVFVFSNMFWNSIKTFGKNLKELLKNIKSEKVFRKKYNLSKLKIIDLFVNSGDKTIVLTPKEFQPFYKTFNKNFCFVGTTIKERVDLIKDADFFIGLSSGLSWIAWCCNVPVVMISGFTAPENEFYTPYRVINYQVCHSCWNDSRSEFDHGDMMWCPRHKGTDRHFECTRAITGTQVINTIKTIPAFQKHMENKNKE